MGRAYVNRRGRWSDEWATPQDFFDALDGEFHFTLDACAQPWNAKCKRFHRRNGLKNTWWREVVWLNPPYSEIGAWLAKARRDVRMVSDRAATVVALVPCVPDRKWWAEHVEGIAEIRPVSGRRLYFTRSQGAKPQRAPFPSVVLVYRPTAGRLCPICQPVHLAARAAANYASRQLRARQ